MKLYENVIIGNFLYSLGLNIGLKFDEKNKPLSIINLLQQTPADKSLGDVLLEFPGVVRLIEFKNKKSSLKKEKLRYEQLHMVIKDNENMINISKQIHWYIETNPNSEYCFNRIVPYLEAFDEFSYSYHTLETYLEEIVDEVLNPNYLITHIELKNYLELIKLCQGGGDIGTGGLIINISEKGISYVQISSLMDLRLQHKEFVKKVELEYESVMKLEQELEKKITQNRNKNNNNNNTVQR